MVVLTDKIQKRLTIQTQDIAIDTTAIRSLDWERDRFDIEFGLQNGTTYNSFIIRGDKLALVDTSHEKFRQLYLDTLKGLIDPTQLDYLIISHTEPDHSGLVRDILDLAPNVTVVGSKVAIQFLENFVHKPFTKQIIKNGDVIDLGKGHEIEFVIAPNLHWPDTSFSFDRATQILYTCDAFGMHYCSDVLFDEDLSKIEPDYQFYYECLMAPNSRSVLSALKRMGELPTVGTIATGHGPLLRYNVGELVQRYQDWSQLKAKGETTVAVFYVADYGYSDRLSQALARGITKTGVAVEMMDLKSADPQEVQELVGRSTGIAIGMPPGHGKVSALAQAAIGTILVAAKSKQSIGLFESYGGDDEPVDPLLSKFREINVSVAFPPIRVKEAPTEAIYQQCEEAGTDLGQLLTKDKAIAQMKSLDSDLDKALDGLVVGYILLLPKKVTLVVRCWPPG